MYIRMPMPTWEVFLVLLGEIRRALAESDDERERARLRPPTITKKELYELRDHWSALTDDRFSELCARFIDYSGGPFLGTDHYDWLLHVGTDVTLGFNSPSGSLVLDWNLGVSATLIVPMLLRIALVLPPNTPVTFSHVNVDQSLQCRSGRIAKDAEMSESFLEAGGFLLPVVLQMAADFTLCCRSEFDLPETPDAPPYIVE